MLRFITPPPLQLLSTCVHTTHERSMRRRAYEDALTSIPDIVTMVVEALCGLHLLTHDNIPVFAFGHELGALVAFETCRKVQNDCPVKGLFVSGMSCPQVRGEGCKHCIYHAWL